MTFNKLGNELECVSLFAPSKLAKLASFAEDFKELLQKY